MAASETAVDGLSKGQFHATIAITVVFRLLASIAVVCRFVYKKIQKKRLCLADLLVLLASASGFQPAKKGSSLIV